MSEPSSPDAQNIPFVYRRTLFWGDTDTAQIAYTGKFVDFMLEAAESWMRAYLGTDWFVQTTEEKRGGPVVHLELDFMSPLTPKDTLNIEVRIERAGDSSITYGCTGYAAGRRLCFRGKFTSVGFDYASGAKQPLPARTREIIEDYQTKCAAVAAT